MCFNLYVVKLLFVYFLQPKSCVINDDVKYSPAPTMSPTRNPTVDAAGRDYYVSIGIYAAIIAYTLLL